MFHLFSKNSKVSSLTKERQKLLKDHSKKFNIPIIDFDQWDLSLTHISYIDSNHVLSYERLEFLGDSILGLCLANILFQINPQLSEGKMSMLKSNLVDEKTLSQVGRQLQLLDIVKLGRGEKLRDKRAQEKVLCDLFESMLAVIFLDYGFIKCQEFVTILFKDRIDLTLIEGVKDYKTRLQKIFIKTYKEYPNYKIIDTEGPDHGKTFVVEGGLNDFLAIGRGRSKKEAEQKVAYEILKKIAIYSKENPNTFLAKEFLSDKLHNK